LRILHLADRLSERGGAHRHLLGLIEALAPRHEQVLAAGALEAAPPCAVVKVAGLESRTRAPFAPQALPEADAIHVHGVVNPAVLEWAAEHSAVVTVQDHRLFCPGRGKLTLQGQVCRTALGEDTCRGCFEDEGYFRETLVLTRERLDAVARCPALAVLSSYMKDELVAAGVKADRIHVVPPFVHGLRPASPDGPPCVLFAGRLVEAKGVRDAIAAWQRAQIDLPLAFAGTGPLRAELEAAGFEVTGWLDRTRMSAALARARALLLPSRWQEPFGIAGLEALHCGVPVVAWDSGGVREWHPGPLPAWGDVEGLAAELQRAVTQRAAPACGFTAGATAAGMEALLRLATRGVSGRS
jgi:glycosyltransferase involved in cell wall biosynthesis